MELQQDKLLSRAKRVLGRNWKGSYTVPSPKLYPNQWSWDSAFTAIGYSHYVQQKAQRELLSMFEGQWGNGMLPHIIFRSGGNYFPGPERWQTALAPYAPKIETSGVTQPAVHAIAALAVYKNSKNRDSARAFLEAIFPKIIILHRYLLTARDPDKSGLVTILHPWESGFDNSLRWDDALARIKARNYHSAASAGVFYLGFPGPLVSRAAVTAIE